MRYIYIDALDIEELWLRRANAAKTEVSKKTSEAEIQAFISEKSAIWAELKPVLERLSNGKCWYTEAKDRVAYWEVDHYRPKKLYPWLAFDWRNFRLCGGKPNRRKTDEFPLEDVSRRASAVSPYTNAERPLLLDPVCWGDPQLLTFKADGEPTCGDPADEMAVRRVHATVSALGLDSPILCEARSEKWRNCETKIKRLRTIVEANRQRDTIDVAVFSRDLCRDISELFSDRSHFTATAKACASEQNADELVALAKLISQRALQSAT